MKNSYKKDLNLKCITCGDIDFEFNTDKTWVKCKRCGREYIGGYEELLELNQGNINQGIKDMKSELQDDLKKDLHDMLKKTFKGNKNIKFK